MWKAGSVQWIIQHHGNTTCRKRGESLETVWVVSIDKNNWDVLLELDWCLWSGRVFRACCTPRVPDSALHVNLSLAHKQARTNNN